MKTYLALFLFPLLLISCRESIDWEPGLTTEGSEGLPLNTWIRVEGSIDKIKTLTIANGFILLGGEFRFSNSSGSLINFVSSFDGDDFSSFFSFGGTGVYALETIGAYQLLVGGQFKLNSLLNSPERDNFAVFTRTATTGYVSGGVNIGDIGSSRVNVIAEEPFFDVSHVLLLGDFPYSNSSTNSQNILMWSKIDGYVHPFPGGGLSSPGTGAAYHNGALYVCAAGEVHPGINLVGKWDGTSWSSTNLPGSGNFGAEAYSIETYSGVLYLASTAGSGLSSVFILSGNNWIQSPEVSWPIGRPAKLINRGDGNLYLVGELLRLNGEKTSNILRFSGNGWEAVGEIQAPVNDIIKYQNKLYAATDDGLYWFNE